MAKRPTPKKRRAKSKGRMQFAEYVRKQTSRLKNRMNSPYAQTAESKSGSGTEVTTIKA